MSSPISKDSVELAPTWSACVSVYMMVLSNPHATASARRGAMEELERMARIADAYIAEHKARV